MAKPRRRPHERSGAGRNRFDIQRRAAHGRRSRTHGLAHAARSYEFDAIERMLAAEAGLIVILREQAALGH